MKKSILLALFLLATGCSTPIIEGPQDTVEVVTPKEEVQGSVKITDLNYSVAQKEKIVKAEKVILAILTSKEYKDKLLKSKLTNALGLSNEEVYSRLIGDKLDFQLTVKMYYTNNKTVGYTYPNDPVVYTNSKFHDGYTPCEVASNLTHEWTHKEGFGHKSSKESTSVPYTHNRIIKELCSTSLYE